jgi:hypothetical protein
LYCTLKNYNQAGLQEALEKTYLNVFKPAISSQEGFTAVSLLHRWRMATSIAFKALAELL